MELVSAVELFAVGDVYLDRPPSAPLWDDLAPELDRADVTLCNYEAAVSDRGTVMRGRAVPLRTPAALIGPISSAWSAVSLAQNHALDYGEVAAIDTLEHCARHGLPATGLGRDLEEAWRPARLDIEGVAVSVLAIACAFPRSFAATDTRCGVAAVHVDSGLVVDGDETEHPGMPPTVHTACQPADLDRACAVVAAEVAAGRVVLVYVHWGVPGMAALLDYQVQLGHALAEAGAAAVLGTHAHVLQAVEVHGSTPILYGMSHVVFDLDGILTRWPFESGTYGARLRLSADGVEDLRLVPFEMVEQGGRSTTTRVRVDNVHRRLHELSAPLGAELLWDPDDAETTVSLA